MEFSFTVSFFNTGVVAPTQIFHNPVRSSFARAYLARDLEAALSASSITIGFQNEESHQTVHRPTVLQANKFAQNPSEENRTMLTKTVNVLKKIGSAIGAVFGPQEVEAMNPAIVPGVVSTLSRLSTWIMLNQSRIQGFLNTVTGIGRLGQVFERSKTKSYSPSAPIRGRMTPGGGSVLPPEPEHDQDPKKERKIDDKKQLDDFVRTKVKDNDFIKTHGTKSGKPIWKSGRGKDVRYYQKSNEGWELEVYDRNGDHLGVLKSDGVFHPELKVEGRSINVR